MMPWRSLEFDYAKLQSFKKKKQKSFKRKVFLGGEMHFDDIGLHLKSISI